MSVRKENRVMTINEYIALKLWNHVIKMKQ